MDEQLRIPRTPSVRIRAHRGRDRLSVFLAHRGAVRGELPLPVAEGWREVEAILGPAPTRDGRGWRITLEGLEASILRFRR
ncbi:MAG: hypothetical protein RML12_10010 [Xanthomonadales bacterium]|nr:hypothetical protein [Xanthomonadales bacterium]